LEYKVTREKGAVKIEFTVPGTEWESEIESVYKKNIKKFNIPGFRKGQAPRRVVERHYGEGVFFEDALDGFVQKGYVKALTENEDIYPVDRPKVDLRQLPDGGGSLVFSMEITVRPEVGLGAYTGIKTEKTAYNVEEKDVEAELSRVRERAARTITVTDRAVQNGDTLNLDYAGAVDGIVFEGGTAERQTLTVGSNSFIPGFEERLIGLATGEERDITVQFPGDYHAENLRGKTAVFSVKINGITFRELPELTDEFARDTTKFDSLQEYKDDIFSRLSADAKKRTDTEMRAKIVELAAANAEVEIPDCMVEKELDDMLEDFAERLRYAYQGLKIEEYFKYTNSSAEDYKNERRAEAEKALKTRLVLQEILKKEGLEATEAETDAEIQKLAEIAQKDFNTVKGALTQEEFNKIRNDATIEKLFGFLLSNNVFEEKKELT